MMKEAVMTELANRQSLEYLQELQIHKKKEHVMKREMTEPKITLHSKYVDGS